MALPEESRIFAAHGGQWDQKPLVWFLKWGCWAHRSGTLMRGRNPWARAGRKPMIIVHMDDAKHHRSKLTVHEMAEFRMTSAPHLPFRLNISPSGFYVFDYLKTNSGKRNMTTTKNYAEWSEKFYVGSVETYFGLIGRMNEET
jgi:hypothetical protein